MRTRNGRPRASRAPGRYVRVDDPGGSMSFDAGVAAATTDGPFDLVITGGTLVDGSGAPPRAADVAVAGGRIAAVAEPGTLSTAGADVVDATGALVTPGFVDIHTHYDGQATW